MTRRTKFLAGSRRATPFLGLATALAAAASGTSGASAQPVSGLYIAGSGGVNLLQDEEVRLSPSFPGGKTQWDAGTTGLGSIGYGFGNGVRVEIEGNWRENTLQHFEQTSFPTEAGGNQQNYGYMGNVLFDMDVGQNWIYPYLGIGVGEAFGRWDLHLNTPAGGASGNEFYEHLGGTTSGNFAYQAMFGVGLPIPWVVGLSATLEYRFYSVLGPNGFSASSIGNVAAFGNGPYGYRNGNVAINTDYNHSFLLGLRYEFNPAPPPGARPAPVAFTAPAPAPARTYLVFFDWDRAILTPRAREIVAEAAQNSTRVQTTEIAVDGYADTSHALPGAQGQQYNLRLSMRRADAVREALVQDGVPASIISVHAYGDTNLLVPTGPNVREPQNRRVEIILH